MDFLYPYVSINYSVILICHQLCQEYWDYDTADLPLLMLYFCYFDFFVIVNSVSMPSSCLFPISESFVAYNICPEKDIYIIVFLFVAVKYLTKWLAPILVFFCSLLLKVLFLCFSMCFFTRRLIFGISFILVAVFFSFSALFW